MIGSKIYQLIILSLLILGLSSCATVNVQGISGDQEPPIANIDDDNIFEEREYTAFNDQGDHLEELVTNGFYRKAARLYDKYNDSYFMETGSFSHQTKKEKYAPLLDMIAKHFGDYFLAQINETTANINSYQVWPAPPQSWTAISSDIKNGEAIIDEYSTFALLTEDKYKIPDIQNLEKLLETFTDKLNKNAVKSFQHFNHFIGEDFFKRYPFDIQKKNDFFTKNFNFILEELQSLDCKEIELFNKTYLQYAKDDTDNVISNLYIEKFINEQKEEGSNVRLLLIIEAIKAAKDKGFLIHNIEGQKVAFVEATSKSLIEEGYIEFPVKVNIDLPFVHKACELGDAFSEVADSNFVIVFDVAQANVKRRIKNREQIKSKYLSGYKEVSNPNYRQTLIAVREAERGLMQAQNTYCGGGWAGVACAIGKGVAVGTWQKRLNTVNQSYVNTPEYIQEEIHKNYKFSISNAVVTKSMTVNYYVLDRVNKNYFKSVFDVSEQKSFKLAYSLKDEDTKLASHLSIYNSEEDIESFEDSVVSVDMSSLIEDYLANIEKTKILPNEESLRAEMLHDKNIALSEFKSKKYETKALNDPRFNNVVVVFNPEGSIGTGFFVEPNLVLTNYHVVEGAKFLEMKLHNGLETFGKLVKSDVRLDLALIRVEARGEPVTFYDSNLIDLGEEVEAIGHPSGLEFSITRGVVSAIRERESVYDIGGKEILFIQTDASINPGNSGGPLFLGNKLIGVNNQKIVSNSVEGLGFAIHHSEVENFLKEDY